jgi:hypothetical protein
MKTTHASIILGILLLFIIGLPRQGYTQEEITVRQVKETISQGEQTGFEVIIPQANLDEVKKSWIKKIQQGVKSKALESGNEISIAGALVKEISLEPLNIYSLVTLVDSSVRLVAFFEMDSLFFDPEIYEDEKAGDKILGGIQAYLRTFAVDQYEFAVEEELKAEQAALKELNKQLQDIQKEEEKMESSIKDEENRISQAEEETRILKAEREKQTLVVEEKRIASATLIDKEAQKAAKDEIKAYEKERDKTDKEINKQEKAIENSKSKIKDYEKAIEEGAEQQELLTGQIEKQEEVVLQVEEKLKGIK